jgi:hypothetical protein
VLIEASLMAHCLGGVPFSEVGVNVLSILSKAWSRFKIIGGVVGNYQGRTIALAFYYTILVPFGLGVRLFSDPLRLKQAAGSSTWLPREAVSSNLDDARRQY